MLNEDLKNFVEGIGAMAETTLLYYKASIKAGASIQEAYLLTRAFIEATLSHNEEQDDG